MKNPRPGMDPRIPSLNEPEMVDMSIPNDLTMVEATLNFLINSSLGALAIGNSNTLKNKPRSHPTVVVGTLTNLYFGQSFQDEIVEAGIEDLHIDVNERSMSPEF